MKSSSRRPAPGLAQAKGGEWWSGSAGWSDAPLCGKPLRMAFLGEMGEKAGLAPSAAADRATFAAAARVALCTAADGRGRSSCS